jgi:glycosyltransferase involved in cell wall biosynthesis
MQDLRGRALAARQTGALAQQVQAFSPDVIVTRRARYDYGLDALLGTLRTAYVAEVNAVLADEAAELTHHRMLPWERRREAEYLLGAAGAVCVTEEVRHRLRSLGVAPERLHVLANGVDTDLFSPHSTVDPGTAEWARRFTPVFGYVGTLSPTHDTPGLLEVASAVARAHPRAGFLFVGPERGELERQPGWSEAIGSSVHCTGRLPHSAVPGYLAAADICWASFRNAYGSPLKLYEFLALGKPVVLAGEGQAAAVVDESGCGTAVPRGDRRLLASAAAAMASLAPERRAALGENGRRWVEGEHTWAAVARQFAELALQATHEGPPSPRSRSSRPASAVTRD